MCAVLSPYVWGDLLCSSWKLSATCRMFIISVSFFPVRLDQLWPTAFDYPFVLLQWKPFNISFYSSKSFSLNISFFTFVIPHFLGLFALIHIMLLSNLLMIHFSMAAVKLLIFIIMALRYYTSLKMKILMCEISFMSFTVLWLFEKGLSDYHTYRNLYWASRSHTAEVSGGLYGIGTSWRRTIWKPVHE